MPRAVDAQPDPVVQAVVAQSDGTVMNVAFRGPRELARAASVPEQILPDAGNFWEDRQARALGDGDISLFGKVVARSDMERRVTRPAEPVTGFQQRVYTSDYTLPPGEGVSLRGVPGRQGDTGLPCDQYFHYLGKYQPYGVYVPEAPGPHELQLVLHGCEANHASQINQPNFQAAFGDARIFLERYVSPDGVEARMRVLRTQNRVIIRMEPERVVFRM